MSRKISEIMATNLITVHEDNTLKDAEAILAAKKIHHLMVVSKGSGKLVGILSDRDVKKYVSPFATAPNATERERATLHIKVSQVMTKNVVSLKPDGLIKDLVEVMLKKKIHAVPILESDNRLIGVVTSTDLMRILYSML